MRTNEELVELLQEQIITVSNSEAKEALDFLLTSQSNTWILEVAMQFAYNTGKQDLHKSVLDE